MMIFASMTFQVESAEYSTAGQPLKRRPLGPSPLMTMGESFRITGTQIVEETRLNHRTHSRGYAFAYYQATP
jgi:hypothetical protein